MIKNGVKSEQINSHMQMVMDFDEPLTKDKDILQVYKKALGEQVQIVKFQGTKRVILYTENNINHYIITASVTYLGNPHPLFKKRLQLQPWYKEFYNKYSKKLNTTVNIIGVYHYDDMEIYCDFNAEDYINRKMHSSSAHVYTNDWYQAKGTEWPGCFLEFKVDGFIQKERNYRKRSAKYT